MTTFADRPGYQRISSSLWKQREDYCASLIQKAWKFHKLRNTESHTEDPHTGDEDDLSSACHPPPSILDGAGGAGSGSKTVKLPPIHLESKHLIEVRSADEDA